MKACLLRLAPVCLAASLSCTGGARADTMRETNQDGYARLLFTLTPPAEIKAEADGGVLTISFARKIGIDPQTIAASLGSLFAGARADADGKSYHFALNQPVRLHVSRQGALTAIDLAPENFTGTMPDLKPPPPPVRHALDVDTLPTIKLRTGTYAAFTRLVFDWPKNIPYTVFPGAGKMTIRFDTLAKLDLSVIARFAPPWVKNAAWRIEGGSTIVEFETDSDSGYHDFRDGTHVVLDILAPGTRASAYAPPGDAKPGVTAMSPAQAQAIAETVARLDPQKAPAKAPEAAAKPAPAPQKTAAAAPIAPQPAPAPTPVQPAPPAVQATAAALTRDGVVLVFKGAGPRAAAVFVRGLTAWIVLEDAPDFDDKALKSALGDFPARIDASRGSGVNVLRITLKQPEAIAAQASGNDLTVTIGAAPSATPVVIGFARNQNDPARASLTTLLPGADRLITLQDPAIGDTLMVVPATAGRAMPQPRIYAEFEALQTASGLVIEPFADELNVGVQDSRIAITVPGGLKLTPPQTPAATSPASLAAKDEGPGYIDFASWGVRKAGSFLATERKMEAAIAHAGPAAVNPARLALARFFLANDFAAETLGLIDLMQQADPALAGDRRLSAMRAAASYMMGRYRDAHDAIADASFDTDRHAALWRGLIAAASQNWSEAHADLAVAQPVLHLYPAVWQARAHLADAEAALGLGRLELADAALRRLPPTSDPKFVLRAELVRARIAAAEKRYAAAAPLFAAVEDSGTEPVASEALYYRIDAALKAGAMKPKAAIDALERLRFRWRGDAVELMTLRKLASLYFAGNAWRDGLRTLRVAATNFASDDAARTAQDEMRAAFVKLYLKGAADKMPPIESLSLFYEFIDLTPIGPDGDEMIRRMADRLVAVDLLGPAADLLSYQVNKRLDGVARAQVATRLATIYLMDHKPQAAIDALHATAISGLPDDVGHQRMLLEARGFAALKQWDNAIDLIGADDAPDTRQLRADIYWESGNWAVAGQKAEALLDTRWNDAAPLTGEERQQVLRAAVAYSLADDETSLDRLRDHFTAKMAASPDASAFAVLSQSIAMHGLAFRDAAAKIASVDTLESFMKDFGARRDEASAPRS